MYVLVGRPAEARARPNLFSCISRPPRAECSQRAAKHSPAARTARDGNPDLAEPLATLGRGLRLNVQWPPLGVFLSGKEGVEDRCNPRTARGESELAPEAIEHIFLLGSGAESDLDAAAA